MSGRAPGGNGETVATGPVPLSVHIISSQIGMTRTTLSKAGGKIYPKIYSGILALQYGKAASYQAAYCMPSDSNIKALYLPGWSQITALAQFQLSEFANGFLYHGLLNSKLADVRDKDLVIEEVNKLLLIQVLSFIDKGANVIVPNYEIGGLAQPLLVKEKTYTYDQALSVIGCSIVDVTIDDLMAKIGRSGYADIGGWDRWYEVAKATAKYLSNGQTWRLSRDAIVSDWKFFGEILSSDGAFEEFTRAGGKCLPLPPSTFPVVCNASNVNLRDKPEKSGKVLATVNNGARMYQLSGGTGANKDWAEVFCLDSEKYGYMSLKYFDMVSTGDDGETVVTPNSQSSNNNTDSDTNTDSSQGSTGSDQYVEETPFVPKKPKPGSNDFDSDTGENDKKDDDDDKDKNEPFFTPEKIALVASGVALLGLGAYLVMNRVKDKKEDHTA